MNSPITELARKLVHEGKFATEHEAEIDIIKVFGMAMRGKLSPTTAEAEVMLLEAQDAFNDLTSVLALLDAQRPS